MRAGGHAHVPMVTVRVPASRLVVGEGGELVALAETVEHAVPAVMAAAYAAGDVAARVDLAEARAAAAAMLAEHPAGPADPDGVPWRAVLAHLDDPTPEGVIYTQDPGEAIRPVGGGFPRPLEFDPYVPAIWGHPELAGRVEAAWIGLLPGGGLGVYAAGTLRAGSALHDALEEKGQLSARLKASGWPELTRTAGGHPVMVMHRWRLSSIVIHGPAMRVGTCRVWIDRERREPARFTPAGRPGGRAET